MKNKNYIYNKVVLPLCIVMAGLFTSCSAVDDFLTVYPTNQITGEEFWEDKNDLKSVVASCYVQLYSCTHKMFVWGEVRSDNFLLSGGANDWITAANIENIRNIMNANLLPENAYFDWASFYTGISYCNLCLQKGPEIVEKDASFSENDWKPIEAELKALRALYYFYLVRAFRDVPLVTQSNDTSEGVTEPVPQTSSEEVLTFLINDLESVKDNGMINYGNSNENKTRITKNGVYALLCDIYLWRASKNSSADSLAKYPGEAEADYRKVIEYADVLTANLIEDFKEDRGTAYYGSERSIFKGDDVTPLPLYETNKNKFVSDDPYNEIFGTKCSLESIFEIGFDGSANKNTMMPAFLGRAAGNRLISGCLSAAAAFQSINGKPDDATVAYSKSDLRYYENIEKTTGTSASAVFNITKNCLGRVTTDGADDVAATSTVITYSNGRSGDSRANFIVYRISDILLMKAEAIACLQEYVLNTEDEAMLREGFKVAKAVFARSNPMIDPADDLAFELYNSPQALEEFVLRERQRELFAEGKRWFDLVRYALRQGNTSKMLNLLVVKYSTNSSAIKAKLATLNSLFNPVYKEEIKVNTGLVQNPAWITDETIVKN